MADDTDPERQEPDLPPQTKLTATKQLWAKAGKFLTGAEGRRGEDRLPPGQHLVRDWPVLDLGVQPTVRLGHWRLDSFGAVERDRSWDWNGFSALQQEDRLVDIHCVTSWSRYDNRFTGVPTRSFLDAAAPLASARFVVLHSADGYTTNVSLEDFAAEDALLAHRFGGEPLSREHGGPLRLVLPHLYFWKSAKWLQRIEFLAEDRPGFWEVRGYHNRGDPFAEERYSAG